MIFLVVALLVTSFCSALSISQYKNLESEVHSTDFVAYQSAYKLTTPVTIIDAQGVPRNIEKLEFKQLGENVFYVIVEDKVKELFVQAEKPFMEIMVEEENDHVFIKPDGKLKHLCENSAYSAKLGDESWMPISLCGEKIKRSDLESLSNGKSNLNIVNDNVFMNRVVLTPSKDRMKIEALVQYVPKYTIMGDKVVFSVKSQEKHSHMYLEAFVEEKKVGFTGQLNVPEKEFYSLTLKNGTNRIVFSDPSNELADMAFAFYKSEDLVVPGEFGSLDTPELPLFAVVLDGKKRLVKSHGLFSKDKIISLSDSTINVYLGADLVCKEMSKGDICQLPKVADVKTVKVCKGKSVCVGYEIYPLNENLFRIDGFTLIVKEEVEEFLKSRNFELKNVETLIPYKEYQTAQSSTKVLGLFNQANLFSIPNSNQVVTRLDVDDNEVDVNWVVKDLGLTVENSYLVGSFLDIEIIADCAKDQVIEVEWILRSDKVDKSEVAAVIDICAQNVVIQLKDKIYNQVGFRYKDMESSFHHFKVVDFLITDVIFPRQGDIVVGERVHLSVMSSVSKPEFYGTLFLDDKKVEMEGLSSQKLNLPNFSFQNVKVKSFSGDLLFEKSYKTPITIHPIKFNTKFYFSDQQVGSKNPVFFVNETVRMQVVSPLSFLDNSFQVIQSNKPLESKASFNRKIMLNTTVVGSFDVAVKIGETNHVINQIEVVDFSSFFTKKDHFVHDKIVIHPFEKVCKKRFYLGATITYLDNAQEVVQKVDLCKKSNIEIKTLGEVKVTFKTDFGSFERVLNIIKNSNQKEDKPISPVQQEKPEVKKQELNVSEKTVKENDENKDKENSERQGPSALIISLISVSCVLIAAVGGFLAYRAKKSNNRNRKY